MVNFIFCFFTTIKRIVLFYHNCSRDPAPTVWQTWPSPPPHTCPAPAPTLTCFPLGGSGPSRAGARPGARPPGRPLSMQTRDAPACSAPHFSAGAEAVQVQASAQQDGFLGTTATLRCHLPQLAPGARVMQMMWLRREPVGEPLRVAAFHPSRGASYLEPERMEFVAARLGAELRDASLAVRELRADDEGNYTCMFATFPQGSGSADTRLRVLAQPQNQAEALEITPSPEPVPVARCVSTGGRPPARISWSSHLGGKRNNSQVPGPLPGTVTVTSLFTLLPSSQVDGENITCRVEHEGFKEHVLLPVTLTVLYPPEVSISGYNDNWYIGLSEATLNCDIRSNPKPMVCNWTTAVGPLPPPAMAQGPQLLIRNVDESVNTTFICSVTNAIGTGKAELTVLVRGGLPTLPSVKQDDSQQLQAHIPPTWRSRGEEHTRGIECSDWPGLGQSPRG
ncbi:poliovirus receptor homolog isoform X3 [Choloepus didactylus]|uniref:poliovirus receptor homolog isoform X3 n=1 Tax=Choloepus didactylus TaxID=27675 RepID=UPI00189F3889|nr:poliovirus receptor homolog isoform X3 [Choloepus didactylus]